MDRFRGALLLIAFGVSGARTAGAQESSFRLMRGSRTIATESVTRADGELRSDLHIGDQARITFAARIGVGEVIPSIRFSMFRGTEDTAAVDATVSFEGDSATALVRGPGVPPEQHFAPGKGALPYINLSSALLEQIVRRARAMGGEEVAIPLLALENGIAFSATVTRVGADSAVVVLPPGVELRLRVDARGRLMGGSVPSQGVVIVRDGTPEAATAQRPPDYSAPPGAPYRAEEVRVPTPGGFSLAGTLTMPVERKGRVPAAVLITGSGLQDRDSEIPGVAGYRPFRQLADALSRRGIAVLRLDDRGAGASGGDPSRATSADFADDIRAALAYLRTRPEIEGKRLALVGHSEGGIIAPMVAVGDPGVAAVVLMAAPSWTGIRTSDYQLREAWKGMGLDEAAMRARAAANDPIREQMANASPWLRFWLDYDPLPTARRLRAPVLVLQGSTDRQVPAEQAEELAAAIRAGGNGEVTVKVFPDLDHLFLPDPEGTASVADYAALPSKDVPSEVLTTMAEWVQRQLK